MQEGCVSVDPRHARDPAPLSGDETFPRDQRLRLETPGWRVLDFEGNVMRDEEVARHRDRILTGPQVVRDRDYPFSEDLIADSSGTVDASLPVLAKVSSLVEVLRLGGSYELVHQLWSQFTLVASQVNVDVTGLRDEVLVSGFLCHSVGTDPGFSLLFCF